MKRRLIFLVPVIAIVGLLLVKPPSVDHKNPLPTASSQAAQIQSPSTQASPDVASAPNIGGRGDGDHQGGFKDGGGLKDGGGFDHEGNERDGRERPHREGSDDDGGRLPKPPSNN